MKYLFTTLCFFAILSSILGQVVYKPRIQTINKDSPVIVDWIAYSTFEQTVNINKTVEFMNTVDERLTNSIINCDLIKVTGTKKELIKKFICATGDGQQTSLIADLINLSIGDRLYFHFTLLSVDPDEVFIFNIFDRKKIVVVQKLDETPKEIQSVLPSSPYIFTERKWHSKQKIISPQRKKINRTIYNILTTFN